MLDVLMLSAPSSLIRTVYDSTIAEDGIDEKSKPPRNNRLEYVVVFVNTAYVSESVLVNMFDSSETET